MKKRYLPFLLGLLTTGADAQVGIGTVSPNSTLDVRGSFSATSRSFTTSTTATATDYFLVFTGASAATVTLPDASTCNGRNYWIKNAGAALPAPVLTVVGSFSQTIDASASWILDEPFEATGFSSNGTNWSVLIQNIPVVKTGTTGDGWNEGGNQVTGTKAIGTITNFDLPFLTNNTEKMRLSASGNLGIGSSIFNGVAPEKLLINAGPTASFNAVVAKGSVNNYFQLNINNQNSGSNASSDVVATADNGNELINFVDLGINSSANSSGTMGNLNDAYLYTTGNNFLIGTGTAAKALVFMTGGTTQAANERMRIDGSGNVGIGNPGPGYKLDVNGSIHTGTGSVTNGSLVFSNNSNGNPITINSGITSASYTLTLPTIQGGVNTVLSNDGTGTLAWNTLTAAAGGWSTLGNAGTSPATNFLGTTDNQSLVFKANNQLSGKIDLSLNNTLFGYQAAQGAVTGLNNSFFGYQAGYPNTSGASNSAMGSIALVANTTGSGNTAMGYGSLRANISGSNNTAFGNGSGATNTTGSNDLFIGYGADATVAGLSNAAAIGFNAKVASSNSIILGGTGTSAANLGVGTNTFNVANPEKFVVDAGITPSVNAIVGRGTINSYLQLNIQNLSKDPNASSDVVATADNGNETSNYVDMGINGSGNASGVMGNPDDAYLYNLGNNFLIGTGVAAKALVFMTGGTTQSTNERMRIDGTGNVGIGTNNPGNKLDINSGTGGVSGLRLKELPSGAVLFMSATADVAQNNSNFYFDATNYRLSVAAGTSPASTLQVGGSLAAAVITKTASYTASGNDYTILCNNTTGPITISLPTAAGCAGRIYIIKKISSAGNNVTIAGYLGAETIDGSVTNTISTQYSSIMIQSDGSNWYVLSYN